MRRRKLTVSKEEQTRQNWQHADLPKEIKLPDDFEGVVQINVQSQREKEVDTVTVAQAQATNVAVSQLQNLVQPITVQVQQLQQQQQAFNAQTQAQLQALQTQLQMLFMAVLGTPAGADAGERQQMLREMVQVLRTPGAG